jgi:NADPH:quinone reductase
MSDLDRTTVENALEAVYRNITTVADGLGEAELRTLTQTALNEAAAGRIHPVIGQEFELSQPAAAHAAIEARSTTGKTLLAVSR